MNPAQENSNTPPERLLLLRQRDALLMQARAIEDYLGIKPRERVMCPACGKERNIDRHKSEAA